MQCNITLTIFKMEIENIWSQTNFSSAKHLVFYQCVLPHCALPGNGWYWEHMLVPSVRFEKLPWGEISCIVFTNFFVLGGLTGTGHNHSLMALIIVGWPFWSETANFDLTEKIDKYTHIVKTNQFKVNFWKNMTVI